MSERLRTRADLEAWLSRAGHDFFVDEPTLRLPRVAPDGSRTTVELNWRGARGLEIFAPLSVEVDGREAAIDLLLLELNAGLVDAGLRRNRSGVVAGCVAFPDHEGALTSDIVERCAEACLEAYTLGEARLAS